MDEGEEDDVRRGFRVLQRVRREKKNFSRDLNFEKSKVWIVE